MKYWISFFVLASLFLTANAQNQIDKQGRKQGHWMRVDNGVKVYEGDFKDGLEVGTFTYYYANGNVRIKNIYSTPGRYCSHEAYDEAGHLLATGFYNQKNRDGEWKLYDEKGRLVKIANYRMGIKEGVHVVFTSTGDTAEYTSWKDNKRDGRWWKRIGTKGYITGTYVKGSLNGVLLEFNDEGQMVRQGHYKDGDKDGDYSYFENKELTVLESWSMGVLADRKVLLSLPQKTYVSVYNIAYFYPKGDQTMVVTMDGKSMRASENFETIFGRVGMEFFQTIDKRQRVVANISCINGMAKDGEGREVLLLEPKLPFDIFPDDDCARMVKSLMREDVLDD